MLKQSGFVHALSVGGSLSCSKPGAYGLQPVNSGKPMPALTLNIRLQGLSIIKE
jgi:hypothetical protein